MSEPVGWLRAVVAESAWTQLGPGRGGTLVEVIHTRPGESHSGMADPEGNEFTVVLPLSPDVARTADGPKGTPG